MARGVARGDVWLYSFSRPDKRRPVVVLSRQRAVDRLHEVMVAPVTSTVRSLPSEVVIGTDEGLKATSAVNLDHVQTVSKARLHRWLGKLDPDKLRQVCRALAVAAGCDEDG